MAEITASVSIWHLRAEDITLTPNRQAPSLLRLELGNDVHVVFDSAADDTAEQAAAMRKLARLAAEAAEERNAAPPRRSRRRTGEDPPAWHRGRVP